MRKGSPDHPLAHGRLLFLSCLMAGLASPGASALQSTPAYIQAAVNDPERPPVNTELDGLRHPAELLAFAGVRPGNRVADYIPGNGYFTRLLSHVVGTQGRVYAVIPREYSRADQTGYLMMVNLSLNRAYYNVRLLRPAAAEFSLPEQVDLIWTVQNYHDLHTSFMGNPDVAALNRAIFGALRPGGTFLIVDHAAVPGSGLRDTEALHRIDPETVKAEVQAAGFVLEAESSMLRNPADPHTAASSDPSIQGRTDQFVLRFRRPG